MDAEQQQGRFYQRFLFEEPESLRHGEGGEGGTQSSPREALQASTATDPARALTEHLMEEVTDRENLNDAYRRVKANRGAAGVDGMTIPAAAKWIAEHKEQLIASLLDGSYQPSSVRGVQIPKPGGGVRQLGIPTVIDRLVQQAILQVLTPLLDPTFSDSSYGFRPGRGAHDAVLQAREYVAEGGVIVVDMDLEKFFDRVNHDILMTRLARRVTDKRLLKIVRRFLEAGMMQEGVCVSRREGTPQGGPLSPLLANLLLDDLDQELERRGHKFCRYADDCNIYVQSQAAGERVLASITKFLEGKLKLRVNREKSAVAQVSERKFLGYRLHASGRLTIAPPEPPASQGAYPTDHPSQSRRKPQAGDWRTQLVHHGVGDLLPPCGQQGTSAPSGQLGSPQAAVRAAQAAETSGVDRNLPAAAGRLQEPILDDRRLWKGLVANGRNAFGTPRHEQPVVSGTRAREPHHQIPCVKPIKETAGYDEYVRWCGRTGAARLPPTRFRLRKVVFIPITPAPKCVGVMALRRAAGLLRSICKHSGGRPPHVFSFPLLAIWVFGRQCTRAIQDFQRGHLMENRRCIVAVRTYAADPERVYDAWMHPTCVRGWASEALKIAGLEGEIEKVEPAGGVSGYAFRGVSYQGASGCWGRYTALDRPHKIAFEWTLSEREEDAREPSTLMVSIEPEEQGGSFVELLHTIPIAEVAHPENAEARWGAFLEATQERL